MTTPERHEKVYELFVNARKLDDAARAAYLAKACADDPSLREEVEALLAQGSEVTSFLEQPPAPTPLGSAGPDTISSAGKPRAADARAGDALAGIIIEGYEILRELHRGGQGVVFQAIQKATKRKVAIKVLREGPYASKSAQRRFEREIELVAQLKHPNIIAIFDSGTTTGGWQYCAMDYVRGTQLHHHIRENKLTLEETLTVFKQVCDAVQYAHHKGVIHRDLKPSNILVDSEGNAKVLDFGLAKQMIGPAQAVVSITQEIIGTLPYMSPEQAKGNPDHIDTRTDIYALGVILYEILTGHYPYPVVGQMADVLKHIAETPPTPPSRQWTPDSGVTKRSSKHLRAGKCPIDDELQTVILKTLAKERERRYQSAGELARDLDHYLAGEPIDAKRDSGWYLVKKAIIRHKTKTLVSAVFVALIIVFASYVHHQNVKDEQRHVENEIKRLTTDGYKLFTRKRYRSAQAKFDEALRLAPDYYEAIGYKAYLLNQEYVLGDFSFRDPELLREILDLSDRALAMKPTAEGLWNLRAVVLIHLEQFGEAEKACRRALQEDPLYYAAHTNLSKVLAIQGNITAAVDAAIDGARANQKEKEKDKYDDGIWRVLGTLQLHLRDAEAFDSLNTAIEIDRKDQRNRLMLARLYLTLDEHQDDQMALEQAKLADALTSLNDPRFKRILAQAFLRNGQATDALTNAEAALKRGGERAYSHAIISIAALRIGDRQKAAQHFQLAKDAWPVEFKAGREVIFTAEKELLWFDTAAELESLRAEAQLLLESEPR